jgi:hypothetical protein
MKEARPALSRSVEDYLKAIFALTERGEVASTSAIASSLKGSPKPACCSTSPTAACASPAKVCAKRSG